ncbi:sugar ABC transporter substrate-binding protein [Wukongibacter baidiensis]|uniref:ABC transporter substrate-binding protein n=1 Tax=Wukongibacter baidiensis TaxID=1723361 RepID=UPI003D7F4011
MKKVLSIILCVALMVTMLVGCGQKESGTESSDGGDKPVTLTFALWNKDQEPVMQEIVKKFEETHPNIKVNVQLTPYKQFWTKMETAATGGSLPDVFWMNGPRFMKYASSDMLMPISDKIKANNIDMSKYPQGLIDLYTYDGKQYGIPKDWDVTALWYNKKLFDAAGVEYPTNEWTWDDMVEAARKITDVDKGIYGTAARIDDNQVGVYNTIPAADGFVISKDRKQSGYNTEGNVKGINVWLDLIKEGLSPTVEEMTDTSAVDMFSSGKIAMMYAASWNVKPFMENENIRNDIDLVVMPKLEKRAAVIHGLINAISAGTEHPEEAWELVKFLGSKEANEIWAESGVVIPAHKDVLDVWKNSFANINLQAFVEELEYSEMYPSSLNNRWSDVEFETLKQIWNEQISVEEGCKVIYEQMSNLLEQEK